MGRTLRGVYKFLFSAFATPELYARHAQKLWSLHYDNGSVHIDNEPRQGANNIAHARVTRWISHHPFVCKLNGAATLPIYEAMGCHDVRWDTTACQSKGDDYCEWLVHWSRDE
jgi:hypothetical protein